MIFLIRIFLLGPTDRRLQSLVVAVSSRRRSYGIPDLVKSDVKKEMEKEKDDESNDEVFYMQKA